MLDRTKIPFVQAKWFTPTNGRKIDLIVLHSMEAAEKGNTAEAVAHYFATTLAKASAHYNVDNNSIVHCVQEQDVAYGAPGANRNGLHIEHAGYAAQSETDWRDAYSSAMLMLSAQLVASLCRSYDISCEFLTPLDLKAGKRGITTHAQVSRAFGGTHTDPGPNFPTLSYLALVQAELQKL